MMENNTNAATMEDFATINMRAEDQDMVVRSLNADSHKRDSIDDMAKECLRLKDEISALIKKMVQDQAKAKARRNMLAVAD